MTFFPKGRSIVGEAALQQKPYHETFTEQVIEALEKGTGLWRRPWKAGELLPPFNPVSGTIYSGSNRVNLSLPGYADPRWMTLRQANSIGLRVRKGEKARPVVKWQFSEEVPAKDADGNPILDAEGNQVKETLQLERPIRHFSSVFHVSQLDGEIPPLDLSQVRNPSWEPNAIAETILRMSKAVIKHNQRDRAFYNFRKDEICLPPLEQFPDAGNYYSTTLHELGHWTGHTSRMDRKFGPFGSEDYAKEELRAEIATWMLGQDIGIGYDPGQHAAYVKSWIKILKNDPFEILRACRDAEKIKEYVLSMEHKKELQQEMDVPSQAIREVLFATPTEVVGKHEWRCIVYHDPLVLSPVRTKEGLQFQAGTMSLTDWEWRNPGETTWRGSKDWRTYDDHRGDDGLPKSLKKIWDKYQQQIQAAKEGKQLDSQSRSLLDTSVRASEPTFLHVPYAEKNLARAAGAKWDAKVKLWYAPEGVDLTKLQAWRTAKTPQPVPTMDPQQEFAEALSAAGLDLGGQSPVMDGKIHRVPLHGGRPGALDGAYVGYLDGHPAGWYQNYMTGEKANWKATGHTLTEEQKAALKADAAERSRLRADEMRLERDRVARDCAQSFSERHLASSDHPYLLKKGILPLGDIKESRTGNALLVPLFNAEGDLRNVQEISPDGSKRFQAGGEKKGCFFMIAPPARVGQCEVLLAEGYATGVSLHQATGLPVVVAFDAGNLEPVAKTLREKFPDAKIAICADNDHSLKNNVGVEKATAAARNINGCVVVPDFTREELEQGLKDFNDLHQARGPEAIKAQVTRTFEIERCGMER